MVGEHTWIWLVACGIRSNVIVAFQNFRPRDGFRFLPDQEFDEMMQYLDKAKAKERDLGNIIPLLTDLSSNYLCVYSRGAYKGTVCYLSHEDINLNPIFSDIISMIRAIDSHPDAKDIMELPLNAFDYSDLPF